MKLGEGSPTVIGKTVGIRGELTGGEDLFMDGQIDGTITLAESRLTVGANARLLADVSARDVIVFGRVEGDIKATGRVELRQTGSIVGDVASARLSIEEGSYMKGNINLTDAAIMNRSLGTGIAEIPIVRQPASVLSITEGTSEETEQAEHSVLFREK